MGSMRGPNRILTEKSVSIASGLGIVITPATRSQQLPTAGRMSAIRNWRTAKASETTDWTVQFWYFGIDVFGAIRAWESRCQGLAQCGYDDIAFSTFYNPFSRQSPDMEFRAPRAWDFARCVKVMGRARIHKDTPIHKELSPTVVASTAPQRRKLDKEIFLDAYDSCTI